MTVTASDAGDRPQLIHWCQGESCCDPLWEQAYLDFETPEEETRKFLRRYRLLGADRWDRRWEIVELFCGRGNGLVAMERLGFERLEGVDLSPRLLSQYRGRARLYVGDCRRLQFPDSSKDAMVVQGGLHHLAALPQDLDAVLDEVHRVLRGGGRLVVVEPWQTPFLRLVHTVAELRLARRCWDKLDALTRMTEQERSTYERWLGKSEMILDRLGGRFPPLVQRIGWGKLMYVGQKPV